MSKLYSIRNGSIAYQTCMGNDPPPPFEVDDKFDDDITIYYHSTYKPLFNEGDWYGLVFWGGAYHWERTLPEHLPPVLRLANWLSS